MGTNSSKAYLYFICDADSTRISNDFVNIFQIVWWIDYLSWENNDNYVNELSHSTSMILLQIMIYDVIVNFVDTIDDRKTDDVSVKRKMRVRIQTIYLWLNHNLAR